MAGNCGLIGTGIPSIVNQNFGFVQGIANAQISATNTSLSSMSAAISGMQLIEIPPAPLIGSVPTASPFPASPGFGEAITANFPSEPASPPAITPIVANFGTAPTNSAVKQAISFPTAPNPFSEAAPTAQEIATVVVPASPTIDTNIPLPALQLVTLPVAPDIIYPEFDAVLNPHGLSAPTAPFDFVEQPYISVLLTKLNTKVLELLENSTGLAPAVEQAIWARGSEREADATRQAKNDALREGAARGFSYPPGATAARLESIEQAVMSKRVELSREIMIEQARLAQNNLQFAIKIGLELEAQNLDLFLKIAQRSFDLAKTVYQANFDVLTAGIQLYNADVNAYQINASVFKTRMEAEVVRFDAFRSEIEAQKIIGEINRDAVAVYTAQLQALQMQANVYESQMKGVAIAMEIEKTKIDMYKVEVDAFQSLIQANKVEFEAYTAQINAEMSKVDVYKADISAYQAEIQAYATQVQAESSRTTSEANLQEMQQKSYAINVDAYKARVSAEAERIKGLTSVVMARAEGYKAEIAGYNAETAASVSIYSAEMGQRIAMFEQQMKGVQVELDASLRATQMAVSAIDGAARNSAAIAASAVNAVNVSAGLNESTGNSTNCSTTYSY